MAQKVKIDGLAEAVMKDLTEYADLATVDMKAAVKKAGNTVKKQIQLQDLLYPLLRHLQNL